MSDEEKGDDVVFFGRFSSVGVNDETNHVDHPDIEQWLEPGDDGFKPSVQQQKFRELAYRMAKRNRFFRGEWYEATRQKGYKGARINERVWNRWCEDDKRFREWFYSEFPETRELSDEEFKMMDSQYWTGVRDAMTEGEEWAYRQYAKTRFDSAAAKKDQADSEAMSELRNYFSTGGGDAWSMKPGEA
tara:strand:- start:320 stop:883 length:564 start_codon:yes stop_codon:yes gene_type:complete